MIEFYGKIENNLPLLQGGALAVLTSHQHPDLVDGIITLSGMLAVPQDLTPWYKVVSIL